MTLHSAVMTSFFTVLLYLENYLLYVRNVEVPPNDVQYMISYLVFNTIFSRISFRKRVNSEKLIFICFSTNLLGVLDFTPFKSEYAF